ncbi:cellular nucleic acid-binding protein, partial [Trifolium medium]|nr:cellular nucleic acid-binding protein [Trifolium medium]
FSEIRDFPTLVNKSRICDEDGRAKVNYYKAVSDKKRKEQDRGKPYGDKNKRGGESSVGRKKGSGNCYKCGEVGHRFFEFPKKGDKNFGNLL